MILLPRLPGRAFYEKRLDILKLVHYIVCLDILFRKYIYKKYLQENFL